MPDAAAIGLNGCSHHVKAGLLFCASDATASLVGLIPSPVFDNGVSTPDIIGLMLGDRIVPGLALHGLVTRGHDCLGCDSSAGRDDSWLQGVPAS